MASPSNTAPITKRLKFTIEYKCSKKQLINEYHNSYTQRQGYTQIAKAANRNYYTVFRIIKKYIKSYDPQKLTFRKEK